MEPEKETVDQKDEEDVVLTLPKHVIVTNCVSIPQILADYDYWGEGNKHNNISHLLQLLKYLSEKMDEFVKY